MKDEMQLADRRIKWLDCAKLIAIIAVLVDHSNGVLYNNPLIAQASYFSVSLFVLLAGVSSWLSAEKRGISFTQQMHRVGKLLFQYAIATFILMIWYNRFFDWNTYIMHLKQFSIQGQFYFFLFFVQLTAICPMLIKWCIFCNARKAKAIWHLATLLALCFVCAVCINYTYILPVHGGGQFLFGGTYLLLFYCGILFASLKVFSVSSRETLI